MNLKVGDNVIWLRNMERFKIIADKQFLLKPEELAKFPEDENVFVIKNDYSAFRAYSYELRPEASVLN